MPVGFLSEDPVAVYGQFSSPISRAELERFLFLDDQEMDLVGRRHGEGSLNEDPCQDQAAGNRGAAGQRRRGRPCGHRASGPTPARWLRICPPLTATAAGPKSGNLHSVAKANPHRDNLASKFKQLDCESQRHMASSSQR